MTVLVYIDTSKQVGDADHIKVFANADAARKRGSRKTTPKGWRSNTRFWSEPDRPPHPAANPMKEAAN
jgi:hypothetical protein